MSKYIDADKLKYEIERRNLSNYHTTTEGYEEELYEIIDSLQQEQPQVADASKMEQEVDLEKEIERYTEGTIHLPITYKRTPMDIMESDWIKCARHFWNKGYNARKEE